MKNLLAAAAALTLATSAEASTIPVYELSLVTDEVEAYITGDDSYLINEITLPNDRQRHRTILHISSGGNLGQLIHIPQPSRVMSIFVDIYGSWSPITFFALKNRRLVDSVIYDSIVEDSIPQKQQHYLPESFLRVPVISHSIPDGGGYIMTVEMSAIPLPATAPFLLAAIAGMATMRRRKYHGVEVTP